MKRYEFVPIVLWRLLIAVLVTFVIAPSGFLQDRQNFPPSNRKPACGCYVCGLLLAVQFPNKDKDCVGILATDACPEELARMPAEQRKAACQLLKAKSKNSSLDECLILRHACETGENPLPEECNPPAPWFDPAGDCTNIQSWQITQTRGTVSVSMCGQIVFSNPTVSTDPIFSAAYIAALKDNLRGTIGDKVCCDKFRDATRADTSCDPRKDVDCDGKPNSEDQSHDFPDINILKTAAGATVDQFPAGLNLSDIYPRPDVASCQGCSWQLLKGELKCNVSTPEGQRHVYQAKWKCPSTGVEVDTFKYAPATAACSK
jgi:hypothetical protein